MSSTFNKNGVLTKIGFDEFKPIPFLTNPFSQTIVAYYRPPYIDYLKNYKHFVSLPDKDVLVLVENTPDSWQPDDRIIVLIHGLAGSHLSNYNIRLSKAFFDKGYKVIRVNLRGCGPGLGLARFPHHAGHSDDARFILYWITQYYPHSKITQVGFSLGGNITLKMLGESHLYPLPPQLDSGIAVSPPIDILASSLLMGEEKNKLFDQFFAKHLVRQLKTSHKHFPDLPKLILPDTLSVSDLNDIYIAPRSGFKNALDYYSRASAGPLLKKIRLPTLIVHAEDDPFISINKYLPCSDNKNIDFVLTQMGGHLGWIGTQKVNGKRRVHQWMDELLVQWLGWFDSRRHQN